MAFVKLSRQRDEEDRLKERNCRMQRLWTRFCYCTPYQFQHGRQRHRLRGLSPAGKLGQQQTIHQNGQAV